MNKPKDKRILDRLRQNDKALTSLSLSAVSCKRKSIGDSGMAAIMEAISCNTALIELDLKGNHIGMRGIRSYTDLVLDRDCDKMGVNHSKYNEGNSTKKCSSLTSLDLEYNLLGVAGSYQLSEALCSGCCRLTYLNISSNFIGDRGASVIADAIVTGENNILESLILGYNLIRDKGAQSLARCLSFNRSLRLLSMTGNLIEDPEGSTIATFAEAMSNNITLTTLILPCPEHIYFSSPSPSHPPSDPHPSALSEELCPERLSTELSKERIEESLRANQARESLWNSRQTFICFLYGYELHSLPHQSLQSKSKQRKISECCKGSVSLSATTKHIMFSDGNNSSRSNITNDGFERCRLLCTREVSELIFRYIGPDTMPA